METKILVTSSPEETPTERVQRLKTNPPELREALLTLADVFGNTERDWEEINYAVEAVLAAARHEGLL